MEYRLEEIFDLRMGKTPSRNNPVYWEPNDNKWISIADLSKCGKYITDTKEYLSDIGVEESGISLIPINTVVMSFKLSIGKTAITSETMYSNEAIMSFRDRHIVEKKGKQKLIILIPLSKPDLSRCLEILILMIKAGI